MTLPPFEELIFGELDAAEEARTHPELLLDGFYDHRDAAKDIETGKIFLLLGTKGAGKSAVLEHLRLRHEGGEVLNFDYWDMSSFPIADVRNMKTGQEPGLGRTQSSWELLLLLRLVQRLYYTGSVSTGASAFQRMWKDLQNYGLVNGDWKSQVVQWSKSTAKVSLPFAAEVGVEFTKSQIHLFQLVEAMKSVIAQTEVSKTHIVALDGLDLLYFESENKRQSLSGLIQAVRQLNLWAVDPASVDCRFICCLRSDMFNQLNSSETSKYSTKSATLDWARNWLTSDEIWKLLEGKVKANSPEVSLRKDYLQGVVHGRNGGARAVDKFILEHTRLFPRDLVAALQYIQRSAAMSAGSTSGQLPGEIVKDGIETYCNEYCEAELSSNLSGAISESNNSNSKVASFVDFLARSATAKYFMYQQAVDELKSNLNELEVETLFRQAFNTSFIGNMDRTGNVTFAYRRPGGARIQLGERFLLHNALKRAWGRG